MLVLQMFLKAAFENTFRTNPTKSKTHARLIIQKNDRVKSELENSQNEISKGNTNAIAR